MTEHALYLIILMDLKTGRKIKLPEQTEEILIFLSDQTKALLFWGLKMPSNIIPGIILRKFYPKSPIVFPITGL